MNILVTGANGFLGKSIFEEYSSESFVCTLARSSGDYRICLENDTPVFDHKFDLVVHAAGKAHSVPKSESQKKEFYDINVTGTQNLLTGIERVGLPKEFVFISSVAVYGKSKGVNIDEKTVLNAKDAYGLSKIEAEVLVLDWCQKNNVVGTILRLPLLIGENPPGNLGAMIRAINKGYYFDIAGGKAKKSMVLISDVSKFIKTAASMGGIFNLTDGYHPSFKEISHTLANNHNKRMPFNMPYSIAKVLGLLGDILGDRFPVNSDKISKITSDLTFDDSKARKEVGWDPQPILAFVKNKKI
ncbi:NAD-dependent epimerase/dehydratase family protein [Flavobacterium algicola]|uniref:NAD-dependent epimerase/dehydratase family protein n=1 Tax=Flavobacterium algicola TaxID=556529 RepID=UPI001EFC4C1D|nr:NAD-dependent epimerase/dehydratase family protein [Flavobacterium algicola]MCG9793923.1 NAD-dependent epimerase/dehydratase family protein [Flavobacterium algicola]